jgi:hypothetical protein
MDYSTICFVIMPFGEKTVGDRTVNFDKLYDGIFAPATAHRRRRVFSAHRIFNWYMKALSKRSPLRLGPNGFPAALHAERSQVFLNKTALCSTIVRSSDIRCAAYCGGNRKIDGRSAHLSAHSPCNRAIERISYLAQAHRRARLY